MDQNLLSDCIVKLRAKSESERLNLIYQWITSRRIKLDLFTELFRWCQANATEAPLPESPVLQT